jgi:tellurite methyltransferase
MGAFIMKEILSGNIARYRKKRGLTQDDLAVRLGITFQAVSKWETGQTVPDTVILPELAKILDISMDKLFGYASLNRDFSPYEEAYKKDEYFWGIEPSGMCLKVLELMPPTRPLKLLDIGCGEGKDAVFFARCGYDVSAFDISDAGLDKVKKLADNSRVHVKAFKADIQDFRLEEKFDILYSSGVLHYIKPGLRDEIMESYKSHVHTGGLAAFHVFVNKPFIPRSPDSKKGESNWWKSGELFTYFHDWRIEDCSEYIFDCNSSGVAHKHAANRLYARNIK